MKTEEVIGAFFDWEEKQPGVITNCEAFQAGAAYAATLRQQAGRVDEEFDLRKYVRHMADVLEAGVGLIKVDSDLARLGAAIQAALAQNTQGEAVVPFIVGNAYQTKAGELVRFVSVHNEGTRDETMADEDGVHRYTRRDFGRVTGTAHDYSDPRNTPPLYLHAERARVPEGIRRFVEMFDAKPMRSIHPDVIYAIHTGTEYEAELRMSDLRTVLAAAPSQRAEVK